MTATGIILVWFAAPWLLGSLVAAVSLWRDRNRSRRAAKARARAAHPCNGTNRIPAYDDTGWMLIAAIVGAYTPPAITDLSDERLAAVLKEWGP